LQIRSRRIHIQRMRQMMCSHEQVTRRDGHVLRQLSLDCKVCLVRVGVFKVLGDVQRERKYRPKTREGLIVETHSAKLVLRARRNAWRKDSRRTDWVSASAGTNSTLKDLHRVQ